MRFDQAVTADRRRKVVEANTFAAQIGNDASCAADFSETLDRAARYIVDMQAPNGAWSDFHLGGVGLSDAWTTAYIGTALLVAEAAIGAVERRYVRAALERAADLVQSSRRPDGMWGYNVHVPPDCDSTSWAALFLTKMGRKQQTQTYAALRSFARADGGFATYNADGSATAMSAWMSSHPDVTPVAVCALAASHATSDATLHYIVAGRDDDGLWNSYWYRSPLYSTLQNLIALNAAGRAVEPPSTAVVAAQAVSGDPFELALALEIAIRFPANSAPAFVRDAVTTLLDVQSLDGWWAAAPLLRVTNESVERPWNLPGDAGGALYSDDYFLFTTATVLRALSRLGGAPCAFEKDAHVELL